MPNTHRRRQRDETVLSRRVGVGGVYMNSQLAHDDCRRIRSTIWKLAKKKLCLCLFFVCLTTWILIDTDNFFNSDDIMTSLLKKLSIFIKICVIKRYGICLVSFKIVDRIRRQSSSASCELCSHRRRRRDKTVSSLRRRRCVLGLMTTRLHGLHEYYNKHIEQCVQSESCLLHHFTWLIQTTELTVQLSYTYKTTNTIYTHNLHLDYAKC